jgi:ubiquinone/menaquinone biosynthesis C-methylase UbiE
VGYYKNWVLPPLIDKAMRNAMLMPYRQRLVDRAEGRVLEVGIGSGLNLPLYGSKVTAVVGVDPSSALLTLARARANGTALPVTLMQAEAEAMPIEDNCVEMVLSAWTLCSVRDIHQVLGEIRRVLKPGGRFIFVEHGRAPEPGVARWQDRLTPAWRKFAGGCHLNRDIRALVQNAGFRFDQLKTDYVTRTLRPWTFFYEGTAVRA